MSSASPEKEESIFSNGMRTFVTTVSIAVLFLPILLIGKIEWLMDYSAESSTGIVIGIGVILRATLRRLFQTTTQSVVRTSVGISTRLSGRVVARRFVRLFVRMFGRILPLSQNLKDRLEKDKGSSSELVGNENTQNHYINTLIGCVVLFVSLFCVLRLLPDLSQQSVTHGLSIFIYSALGAIPMLLYLLITPFFARKMNVEVISHLSLSALVLQAYFTGAGSFLPLTNDLSYKGENRSTAKLSAINLSLFILMHLLCLFLGSHWDSQFLTSLGSMFLVYAFVFSFPLFPLEGYYLWRESKVYWLIIWLVIIDLFNRNLEESLFLII